MGQEVYLVDNHPNHRATSEKPQTIKRLRIQEEGIYYSFVKQDGAWSNSNEWYPETRIVSNPEEAARQRVIGKVERAKGEYERASVKANQAKQAWDKAQAELDAYDADHRD